MAKKKETIIEQPPQEERVIKTYEDCITDQERIGFLNLELINKNSIIENLSQDGMYALYFSQNEKANELAKIIKGLDLSNDKDFDKWMKLTEKSEKLNAALYKLRVDYLKVDESKLADIQNAGIPLIERNGIKQK